MLGKCCKDGSQQQGGHELHSATSDDRETVMLRCRSDYWDGDGLLHSFIYAGNDAKAVCLTVDPYHRDRYRVRIVRVEELSIMRTQIPVHGEETK